MTDYNLGRVGIVLKGTYDNSTAYDRLDLVFYQGRSYIARVTTTGNLPTNTTYWQVATYKGKGYVPRGAWETSMPYVNDLESIDVVSYSGVSYYCKVSHTGRADTPDIDSGYWGILVAVGSAESINLIDADNYYTADTVEGAFAEIYEYVLAHEDELWPHKMIDLRDNRRYPYSISINEDGLWRLGVDFGD